MLLRGLVQAIGALVIMLGLSWKLTLVMFSSVPIVIVIAVVYGNYVSDLQEVFQTRLADAGSIAQEVSFGKWSWVVSGDRRLGGEESVCHL